MLIDDKPATIKAVREAGLIGIQFIPPYMNNFEPHPHNITHLSQVNKILDLK